jgi:high-affinity iron transporter
MPKFRLTQWHRRLVLAFSTMLFVILLSAPVFATPKQDVQRLDTYIEQAIAKTQANDLNGATAAFEQYKNEWFDVEDGVKQISRQAYKDIEDAMGEVKFALSTQPPDQTQLLKSLQQLHALDQTFTSGGFSSEASSASSSGTVSIATLIERLDRAETALSSNNIAVAKAEISGVKTDWLDVEGVVATKSRSAYVAIENNISNAYGFLNANPPAIAQANAAIASLKQELQPFAAESLQYNMFDAAVILLREGLEALLVLVALLAFLNKSGNGDKGHWLWMGAGVGVLASIVTAIVIHLAFANVATGVNRELIEGLTGLVAAAMLFYVSYWLHSKSSLSAWQGYIRNRVNTALATNSLWSLAILAFLAVYREGAETTLFYIGIAPSISMSDLLAGLGIGVAGLVIIAALMLGVGLKIPLKPFFVVTSVLIYYLGFKFVGSGIHALQVAGILPATPASFLPASEGWGLYPTWETTLPQLALLLVAIAVIFYTRQRAIRTESTSSQ